MNPLRVMSDSGLRAVVDLEPAGPFRDAALDELERRRAGLEDTTPAPRGVRRLFSRRTS